MSFCSCQVRSVRGILKPRTWRSRHTSAQKPGERMLFRWFVVAERDAEQEVTRYSKTKCRASPRVPIAVLEDDFLYSVFLRRRVVLPILGCEIERLGDGKRKVVCTVVTGHCWPSGTVPATPLTAASAMVVAGRPTSASPETTEQDPSYTFHPWDG
ncbi:hypothetical protein E4U22_000681 [Claviceps purpurea]|nr:hypothetical protein E4U22_000681 [Claviceps purpurea]